MNVKILFLGLLLLLFTSQAYAITDTNLIDYFKYDETSGTVATDWKGFDNNGTISGATINQTGKINKAYYYDGSDDKVTSGITGWQNSYGSISFWYNPTAQTAGKGIIDTAPAAGAIRIYYKVGDATQLCWEIGGATSTCAAHGMTNGTWYHFVLNWSANTPTLYINTTSKGQGNTKEVTHTGFNVGVFNITNYSNGYVDELSVWNFPLNTTQINELYNAGTGLTYCPLSNSFDSVCPTDSINVDFNYVVRKDLNKILLTDTSTVSGVTKTAWIWTSNGSTISTAQDYNLTATELTDYNICLHVDTNVSDVNGDKCYSFNTGDWTPPVTTFSSFQVPNTTDQNILLSCQDNNSGCKAINYNINNLGWINSSFNQRFYQSVATQNTIVSNACDNYKLDRDYNFDTINYYVDGGSIIITSQPRVEAQKTNAGTPNGKVFYRYYYSDGSYEDSNIGNITSDAYSYFYFSLPEKNPSRISLYACGGDGGGGNGIRTRNVLFDFNFIATGEFIYSGAGLDHNIQYFSTDNSDNTETTKTSNFTTYGKGRFYFKDENSGSDLTGVQVNFNGTDYDSGANNYLDFNFQTLSSTNTTYLFTLSKSGYSTRYYQTDLNHFGDFNVTFALLPESLATDLQFKMFPPTGSSVLANTYIEFKDKDANWTVTKLKSNTEGELTANLKSDDQNYLVWISEGTYIYQAVQLTILYPKDEQTLSDITGNWRIEITDNISYQDLNIPQGTSKIIYLLPNTKYPFTIAVQDVAGTYFKRRWSKLYTGNPLTDTLQPYLLSADDGIAVKFVFQDPKRDSIQNIIVNIYKNIGGVKTLISNGASDVTGNALFFLIAGDKYWLDFTYNGVVIFETQNYSVTSSVVYWTLNLVTGEIQGVDGSFINLVWNPVTDFISKEATSIGYKVNGSKVNFTTVNLYTLNGTDKNVFYSTGGVCNTSCTTTILKTNIPYTTGTIYADVNVYTDTNAYVFSYTKKWIIGTTSNIDTQNLFINARLDFGCSTDPLLPCPLTTILSVVLMIILLGGMVFSFNFVNPKGLLIAGLGILAVFTYLGWFWWVALVLMIIASIFYLRSEN